MFIYSLQFISANKDVMKPALTFVTIHKYLVQVLFRGLFFRVHCHQGLFCHSGCRGPQVLWSAAWTQHFSSVTTVCALIRYFMSGAKTIYHVLMLGVARAHRAAGSPGRGHEDLPGLRGGHGGGGGHHGYLLLLTWDSDLDFGLKINSFHNSHIYFHFIFPVFSHVPLILLLYLCK
jgi:hypothetical protein